MRQAFVPATSGVDKDACAKKRRRPVAPGEGEAVSSIYESIVRPGKSTIGDGGSESNRWLESKSVADAGYLPASRASPMALPRPPPSASESGKISTGKRRARPAPSAPRPAEFGPAPDPGVDPTDTDEERKEGFFCRVCGERVKSLSEEKHATSTLHIFNQKHRPQDRKVQIHESNKGFQLLAGMGWKLDEGLGARKQGRVNPLQTTFKRDTTGLGAGEKLRPRVTHFPSHVPSQALNARDGKSEAIRAHESLDRRRGRRERHEAGKRRDRGVSDGSGASKESVSRGGARAEVSSGGRDSVDAWGEFWGQGTQPEVDRFSGGG
ncbi:unnamed protein product, partial [Scytosiphon promiscuus]